MLLVHLLAALAWTLARLGRAIATHRVASRLDDEGAWRRLDAMDTVGGLSTLGVLASGAALAWPLSVSMLGTPKGIAVVAFLGVELVPGLTILRWRSQTKAGEPRSEGLARWALWGERAVVGLVVAVWITALVEFSPT